MTLNLESIDVAPDITNAGQGSHNARRKIHDETVKLRFNRCTQEHTADAAGDVAQPLRYIETEFVTANFANVLDKRGESRSIPFSFATKMARRRKTRVKV